MSAAPSISRSHSRRAHRKRDPEAFLSPFPLFGRGKRRRRFSLSLSLRVHVEARSEKALVGSGEDVYRRAAKHARSPQLRWQGYRLATRRTGMARANCGRSRYASANVFRSRRQQAIRSQETDTRGQNQPQRPCEPHSCGVSAISNSIRLTPTIWLWRSTGDSTDFPSTLRLLTYALVGAPGALMTSSRS